VIQLSGWSDIQSIDEINVGRYFEYDEDALFMFKRWFSFLLHPFVKVIEVGAGSGFFTNKLLELNPRMDLTCLEPDVQFVNYLRAQFGDRVEVVESSVENPQFTPCSYDVAFSHIVIHNLPNALVALKSMKNTIRDRGYVVAIEPHPGSRTHYARKEVGDAMDFLSQVKTLRWDQRRTTIDYPDGCNPWEYCYPQLFHEVGLVDIHSYGWNSVFTLSDSRFDVNARRNWIHLRKEQALAERERVTNELLELGKERTTIEQAYSVILDYFEELETASDSELNNIHEQHVTPRIITIGQK
jgi:SAM-dependent methyltransferase